MQLPIKAVCDDKMDTELLDSLGLGQMSLFTTQGAVCAGKIKFFALNL